MPQGNSFTEIYIPSYKLQRISIEYQFNLRFQVLFNFSNKWEDDIGIYESKLLIILLEDALN